MLKRIFFYINYFSIVNSIIFYSFIIRVTLKYGCQYASLFTDPKEMGIELHYIFAMPYAIVLNVFILLPISFLLLLYLVIKKELHRDTIILTLLNIVFFYFISLNELGLVIWLAD